MTTNAYFTSHTDADAAARPMTPLRRRMIEDMVLRRLAPTTQKHYVRAVAMFAKHFNASPDTLDYEDVRSFRLHLVETGHNVAYVNQVLTALRFFYLRTLGRSDAVWMIPLAKDMPRKLRVILTREQIARLIAAGSSARDRCATRSRHNGLATGLSMHGSRRPGAAAFFPFLAGTAGARLVAADFFNADGFRSPGWPGRRLRSKPH
jgi:hypothetical protein